ncbi:(4Fe-4S)-binding protein [Tessaracoccus sp. ZS01]|uniref:(4Fe-4S)-binding protein n=1 Tax=Tessaracoccus sp. ZS01 TaxID=1906324 RepID=UPI00096F9C2D|nr:(4Fe-4S)-binding protein [Tessaracoccus sp. ZS01]MCG6567578.1 PAS domain S-box protein [Tessaracoccus sp. ZS01]OMG55938.1 hypothetical protein BJN44_08085 [Tessaracoccus sp. ZS01]
MTNWTAADCALSAEVAGWALDSATDAIIVIDEDGLVRAWNRACVDLFGWSKEYALGRDVDFMIPLKLREAHHRGFSSAMLRGALASDGQARRTKSLREDGGSVYIDMTFAALRNDHGEMVGAVAVARPASERDIPTHGRKRYNGPLVDVTFDSALCNHNGQCVRTMPEVFNTANRPWINPSAADDAEREERLRTTVRNCPTGALQLLEVGAPDEDPTAG